MRLISDHDFRRPIVSGLLLRQPGVDLVSARDCGLQAAHDQEILEFAASEGRIVLTHDVNTMVGFALHRVTSNQEMPGLIVVQQWVPVRIAVDAFELICMASTPEEWIGTIRYIP